MKYSEIKNKNTEEVKNLLKERKTRLQELSFLLPQGKIKNVRELRFIKKDIAQIMTFFNLNTHEKT